VTAFQKLLSDNSARLDAVLACDQHAALAFFMLLLGAPGCPVCAPPAGGPAGQCLLRRGKERSAFSPGICHVGGVVEGSVLGEVEVGSWEDGDPGVAVFGVAGELGAGEAGDVVDDCDDDGA
jgi:hypothetical protein